MNAALSSSIPTRPWAGGWLGWVLLGLAFAIRLTFGLVSEFWGEDERQVYLIGLEYFTTGVWPLYGADVVYTETRVPGGLQGFLVGGPLWVVAQPEAPYVVLNLFSFGALTWLGWYISRRVPCVPWWCLWTWIFFSPWTLDVSAHIINTSYVTFGAVLVFIAIFEIDPALGRRLVSPAVAWFSLGAGALWIAQFHLSASLLGPIALVVIARAALADWRRVAWGSAWLVCGALLSGLTLIPTLASVGIEGVLARTGQNVALSPANLLRLPQVMAQFFSFGSFELPRFIGSGTDERIAFLGRYPWAAPAIALSVLGAMLQVLVLIVAGLMRRRDETQPDWPAVRNATWLLLALVYLSFTMSVKAPASHAFYVMMPAVTIYAFYCWEALFRYRFTRIAAASLLVAGAISHIAIAARNFTDRSLYVDRPLVMRAIQEKDYRLVGERRTIHWDKQ